MEQHRDEQIECADCGAAFIFSAAEAAVFADRALAAPKRCKDCRRARKERAASEARGGRPQAFSATHAAPGGARPQGGRYGAPPRRYTGDVNEYRSPMADSFSAAPYGRTARGSENRPAMTAPRNPRATRGASFGHPQTAGGIAPRTTGPYSQSRSAARDAESPHRPGVEEHGGSRAQPARRRPQAAMSAITCDACGAQAEVPFKPAEGREVYCPACYRTRRPAS